MILQLLRRVLIEHLSLAIIGIVAGSFLLLNLLETGFATIIPDWHFDDVSVFTSTSLNSYVFDFSHSFSAVVKFISVIGFIWLMIVQLNYLVMSGLARFAFGAGGAVIGFCIILTIVTPSINRFEERFMGDGKVLQLVYKQDFEQARIEAHSPKINSLQSAYLTAQISLFEIMAEQTSGLDKSSETLQLGQQVIEQIFEQDLSILDAQLSGQESNLDKNMLINLYRQNKHQDLPNLKAVVDQAKKIAGIKLILLILFYGFGVWHLYLHRKLV